MSQRSHSSTFFRTRLKYLDPSDDSSLQESRIVLAFKRLERNLDQLYKEMPGNVGTVEALAKRDSPIANVTHLGVARELTIKRAEQISAELGSARSSLPILKIGHLTIFSDKVEIGVTVMGLALKGSAQVPLGLVKAAADSASKSWSIIRNHPDFQRVIKSASAIARRSVDRITVLADELQHSVDVIHPYSAAIRRGQLNIDDVISAAIRSGHRPPVRFARLARNLNLKDAELTSLDNASDCIEIESIDLDQNTGLSEVQLLARCSNLQFVRLADTLVSDVEFVRVLTKLRKIDIRGTEVVDFEPFTHCKELTDLNIRATFITDITRIRELKNIKVLNIGRLNILRGLSALEELRALRRLDARDVPNMSEEVLSRLESIEWLALMRVPIRSLKWIHQMGHLRDLSVVECPIDDWSYLKNSSVRTLHVGMKDFPLAKQVLSDSGIQIRFYKGRDDD